MPAAVHADDEGAAEFMARMLKRDVLIAERKQFAPRTLNLQKVIAKVAAENKQLEDALESALTYLHDSLPDHMAQILNLRVRGQDVEVSVHHALKALKSFEHDAQVNLKDVLPYDKAVRKAVPLTKRLL